MLCADDHPSQDMTQFFETAIAFIGDCIRGDGRVLVHCGAGISRASTVTIAYLMHDLRLRLDQAYSLVKSVRPCIHPNVGFVRQLRAYEKHLGLA
jgi:protein-tyrosine phosphatase